ncbi:MAG: hypothetical protein Kow0059_05710 [Candidatus Sumerlaeia bacterium]
MTAALAAVLLLSGCVGSDEEVKAQKAQVQQLTERLAGLENQIKRLGDDVDAMMVEMGNQRQAGGLSPELARKIDEMTVKVQKLEAGLNDVQGLKAALADKKLQPAAAPAPAPAAPAQQASAPKPAPKPQVSGVYHKVQQGETLSSIAAKYNTTIAAIRKENGIPPNAIIRTGTKIYVPRAEQ